MATLNVRIGVEALRIRRYLPTNMAGESSSGRSRQIIDRILEDLTELSHALEPRRQSSASPRSLTVEDEMRELFHRRGGGRSSSTSSASITPSTSTWPRPSTSRPITSVLNCVGCVGRVGWKSCVGRGSWVVGHG